MSDQTTAIPHRIEICACGHRPHHHTPTGPCNLCDLCNHYHPVALQPIPRAIPCTNCTTPIAARWTDGNPVFPVDDRGWCLDCRWMEGAE